MNILVLNGSPKGENSITLQTSLYLQKLFPQHQFDVLHVGQRIKLLERDFSPAVEAVQKADLLLFSYPVYTFIAPSQLHRFIELLKASGVDLRGKFATQITTSKHFYDVTAHRYVEDNCHDLGLKYVRGLSADMEDLLAEKGQKEARAFMQYVTWCVEQDICEPAAKPISPANHVAIDCDVESVMPKQPGDVVIITDYEPENTQLQDMIARFQAKLAIASRVVNIREYPLRGGCLGCFNCAVSGECIYTDGFDQFLRNNIQTADAMIFAFGIKDHSMGAVFKQYNDREFCNGHRTVTMGMPVGYLISGNYSEEYNLQMIVEARSEVGGNFLAGIATDEFYPNEEIDHLAAKLQYALTQKYAQPQNFYGIGGMKIFRDLIYLMQGMMKADHKFYKAHGQYDFPQKHKGTVVKMYLVGALLANPKLKKKMGNKMNEGMIAPYKKVLDCIEK